MMTSLISFMNSLKVSLQNEYFDMELCSSDPYGATDYTDDDHIVARKQSLMTSLISFMNSLKLSKLDLPVMYDYQ